jgi:hypothetical protein
VPERLWKPILGDDKMAWKQKAQLFEEQVKAKRNLSGNFLVGIKHPKFPGTKTELISILKNVRFTGVSARS